MLQLHLCALLLLLTLAGGFHNKPAAMRRTGGASALSALLPAERTDLDEFDIAFVRALGKVEIDVDDGLLADAAQELLRMGETELIMQPPDKGNSAGKLTSVRLFEGLIKKDNTRVLVKEFLPIGFSLGQREQKTTKQLTEKWNGFQSNLEEKDNYEELQSYQVKPFFPIYVGSLRTTKEIERYDYQSKWVSKFPFTKPPERGHMWVLYLWDEASYKNLRYYPLIPQTIDLRDYFRPKVLLLKKRNFILKVMQRSLQALNYLHRSGYSHNAVLTPSIWLSTFNDKDVDELYVKLTDLGATQRFPSAEEKGKYIQEDLYQLGFVFLELIASSFSDNNLGARTARRAIAKQSKEDWKYFENMEFMPGISNSPSQLRQSEWQALYEDVCGSSFEELRRFIQSTGMWMEACEMLEMRQGEAWKLVLYMLSRGQLFYESDGKTRVAVTTSFLLQEHKELFKYQDPYGSS